MNIFKKIYCRSFQTVFKIAIPFLPYRVPKMYQSVEDIPEILKKKNVNKVLLVTDGTIMRLGLADHLLECLKENEIECTVYDKTVPNPTTENVNDAYELYINNECGALIGFGGGSSMDCAKATGIRVARNGISLDKVKGILKVRKKLPTLIAIPSTAGTGSETTLAAVIVDSETRHKYVINDFPLIPRYAVLDPEVTKSLPASITATTGMDALTHAVEAYIGNSTTHRTREDAIKAVRLISQNLEQAVFHGDDLKARSAMLRASFYAGCAFTKSYVGYVHAVAHSLGGEYNVPHGLANAVLLPVVLEEYGEKVYPKLHVLAKVAGLAKDSDDEAEAAKKFIEWIKELKKKFEIGDTFPELKEEDIEKLAKYADKEANPLYPVPVLMDSKKLQDIYRKVLAGE